MAAPAHRCGACLHRARANYFVRATTTGVAARSTDADGTRHRPFTSFTAALAAAARADLCRVDLVVIGPLQAQPADTERGRRSRPRRAVVVLSGDLPITRDTKIRVDEPARHLPEIRGAILNPHGCDVDLSNVRLRGNRGRAIQQTGGRLFVLDSEVTAVASGARRTAALSIRGGALAVLHEVAFRDNRVQSLQIAGRGTRAHLTRVSASGGRVRTPHVAAIEVGEGARLWASELTLRDNAFGGLYVRGFGTGAHLRDATFDGSLSHPTEHGGHNLFVFGGASLEVHRFRSDGAGGAGLAKRGARYRASYGELHHNEWGVYVDVRDRECIRPEVRSSDNRSADLLEDELPVPSIDTSVGDGPARPDPSGCASVPWRTAPGRVLL